MRLDVDEDNKFDTAPSMEEIEPTAIKAARTTIGMLIEVGVHTRCLLTKL
jgi:hypothetical protein